MVEGGSWVAGLPFQVLEEAIERRKRGFYSGTKSNIQEICMNQKLKCLMCVTLNVNFPKILLLPIK